MKLLSTILLYSIAFLFLPTERALAQQKESGVTYYYYDNKTKQATLSTEIEEAEDKITTAKEESSIIKKGVIKPESLPETQHIQAVNYNSLYSITESTDSDKSKTEAIDKYITRGNSITVEELSALARLYTSDVAKYSVMKNSFHAVSDKENAMDLLKVFYDKLGYNKFERFLKRELRRSDIAVPKKKSVERDGVKMY